MHKIVYTPFPWKGTLAVLPFIAFAIFIAVKFPILVGVLIGAAMLLAFAEQYVFEREWPYWFESKKAYKARFL